MIDVKTRDNIADDSNWPFIGSAMVKADSPGSMPIPEDASQVQGEEVVQSWRKVAVLKVVPDVDAYFGFQAGSHMQFLNVPVKKKDGLFGARIGDGDVRFFVIPKDLKSRLSLEHVSTVDIDDEGYSELPVY